MFRSLFLAHAPGVELEVFDVTAGRIPATDACDAFLTTGSAASVYDDEPWIHRLSGFVRQLHDQKRILVGICFGHQLIAHALGGSVKPSPRGWGIGSKEACVVEERDWMVPGTSSIRLLLSHQDQIEELPPGAVSLGGNEHCPHSLVAVGETFIGIQGHPEFPTAYAQALTLSRKDRIPAEVIDRALPTFDVPTDTATVVSWIVEFVARRVAT